MLKRLAVALSLGLLALAPLPGSAQPAAEPQDLVIRPGDTIEWVVPSPHRLRVGGSGLTALSEVDKILTFSPAPDNSSGDMREWDSDVTVTAKVKDDADTQGVTAFVFTCGQHPTQMLSLPFPIQAKMAGEGPRQLRIRAEDPLKWVMRKPDLSGDVQVDATPRP